MATFPFSQLGPNLKKREKQILRNAGKIVKTASAVVSKELIFDTPVDTGKARSNWVGTLQKPFLGVIAPYSPLPEGTNPAKKFERANASAAFTQNAAAFGRFDPRKHTVYYISNGVRDSKGNSYIGTLNLTSRSKQTPPGFVWRAIAKAKVVVRTMQLLDK
jgi:hypothetical protein